MLRSSRRRWRSFLFMSPPIRMRSRTRGDCRMCAWHGLWPVGRFKEHLACVRAWRHWRFGRPLRQGEAAYDRFHLQLWQGRAEGSRPAVQGRRNVLALWKRQRRRHPGNPDAPRWRRNENMRRNSSCGGDACRRVWVREARMRPLCFEVTARI